MSLEPDRYEQEFMEGATSLARSKVRIPWYVSLYFVVPWLIMLTASLLVVAKTGALAGLLPAVLGGFFILGILLLHTHLRLTVTSKAVHVQLGLFGPTIPLSKVVSCEAVDSGIPDWLAWGVKWQGPRKWAYFSPGADSRGVKIVYIDEAGTEREVFVSCHSSEEIASVITTARASAAAGTGVRAQGSTEQSATTSEALEESSGAASQERKRV